MWIVFILQIMFLIDNAIKYNEKFIWSNKKFKRPKWAGEITGIIHSNIIRKITGVVLPISTNKKKCPKRPFVAPLPINLKSYSTENDKGHVMALELGGPNARWNIVMQPSSWQRFGYWRQFEKIVMKLALRTYDLENSLCADEAINMIKPNNVLVINYNLKYTLNHRLRCIAGRLFWGQKAVSFYIPIKGRVVFNQLKLYELEQKLCS